PDVQFKVEYVRNPYVGGFLIVYQMAFIVYALALAYTAFRAARAAPSTWIRRGLRTVGTGATIALGYPAGMATYEVAYLVGAHPKPAGERTLSAALIAVASVVMM